MADEQGAPRISMITFLPLIGEVTMDLADGHIDQKERQRLIAAVFQLMQLLIAQAMEPKPPAPVPVIPPAPPAPTQVTPPTPAPVTPTAGTKLRIVSGKARVSSIYGRDNVTGVGEAATQNVLNGGNFDNGWHMHTDSEWTLSDGSVLQPGDPRWAQVNRWAPNGNAIFPYYEYDGQVTDIRHGDHGSDYVDPKSFEDDEGCTVTFEVETPAPHNTQHTFRFGYMHKNEDGLWVDTGLIGQGNRVNGDPFKVR